MSVLAYYVGRMCQEFPALKPSDVFAERARLPEGFLDEIVASLAFARAVAANETDPKGWQSSDLRIMAKELEHERAEEEIAPT